jgi:predicted ABC-type sugar transport system permease subunit
MKQNRRRDPLLLIVAGGQLGTIAVQAHTLWQFVCVGAYIAVVVVVARMRP